MMVQSATTVNNKLGIVRQCFTWLDAQYDEAAMNPVPAQRRTNKKSAKEDIDPYTPDQISKIFSAPLFTGCQSERFWSKSGDEVLRHSAMYWVPLIGLFTGMRSNEICQLSRDNIRQHQGVHYIALTPDLKLKNAASVRNVPLHQDLLALGLMRFLDIHPRRLFPELPQHRSGRYSDAFGKKFARLLKSLDIKSRKLNFHSFRHTFDDLAHFSRLNHDHKQRLLGRVLQGEAARYGQNYKREQNDMDLLKVRNEEMQKVDFGSLDLSSLRSALNKKTDG